MSTVNPRKIDRRALLKGSAAAALPSVMCTPRITLTSSTKEVSIAGSLAQNDSIDTLVAGNSAFAFDVYAEMRKAAAGNLLFSPYSLSTALAMTYAGAKGETATQMADVLSFTIPQPALHDAFSRLSSDLIARGNAEASDANNQRSSGLRIANGVWVERTYRFSESYNELLERYYGTKPQRVDFINEPDTAQKEINDWVAEQTEKRIQDIVPDGAITSDTRLVLADAIYFSGGWQSWFSPHATGDDAFILDDGTSVTVPFMVHQDHFPYARAAGFQVIEFPYVGSGFSFTVILPNEGKFDQFESGLNADGFSSAVSRASMTEVLVHLPRFKFDASAGFGSMLHSMGMTDAFTPARADFTAMVAVTPPKPLYIGEVLHKAFMSVDEQGTEAAAATVVRVAAGGAAPEGEKPFELHINRPFLFAIRDTQSGTLLFLGRVLNPTG